MRRVEEIRMELDKVRSMRIQAQKSRNFVETAICARREAYLVEELKKETLTVGKLIEGCSYEQVSKLNDMLCAILFFCDAMDSIATDYLEELRKIDSRIIQLSVCDKIRSMHKTSKELVYEIDEIGSEELSQSFGDLCDTTLPLVMNKIKKFNRPHQKYLKAKYK